MARILIIDDDIPLCDLLLEYLEPEGFEAEAVHDGKTGLDRALTDDVDLIVLDVMLPEMNGFDVLQRIRSRSDRPVLMLTARGEEVDRIVGLEMGADDYLPKPFNPRELAARVRAILRRSGSKGKKGDGNRLPDQIDIGDIRMDTGARVVHRGGDPVELTSVEFNLLEMLLKAVGRVVTREQLAERGLGRPLADFDRGVDVHVSNLRKKLGRGRGGSERIKSVRGVGYLFAHPGYDAGKPHRDEEKPNSGFFDAQGTEAG